MKSRVLSRVLLGALLGLVPVLTRAQDGPAWAGWMANWPHGHAAWAGVAPPRPGSAPVAPWGLALIDGGKRQPIALQAAPPRFTLAARMRFASRNPNSVGYCAKLGFFDNLGNVVEMGVRADFTDPLSLGVPMLYSEAIYGIDMGQGPARGEYRPFEFKPDTWYQLELRYLDDQSVAQLWVDGVMQPPTPIKLTGRIFVTLKVCGQQNGDQITADFQNVTMGGIVPGGNGYSNEVVPNGDWNTHSDSQTHGLIMRQTDLRPHVRQNANFHGDGMVVGAQPKSWPAATALNTEYWFGQ